MMSLVSGQQNGNSVIMGPPSGNKSSENPWRYICTAPSDVTCGAGVGAERPREARRALAGARAVVAGPVTCGGECVDNV